MGWLWFTILALISFVDGIAATDRPGAEVTGTFKFIAGGVTVMSVLSSVVYCIAKLQFPDLAIVVACCIIPAGFGGMLGTKLRQFGFERAVHDLYVRMLCTEADFYRTDAEQSVSQAMAMCKQQGIAEGTTGLPHDFGDRIIDAAQKGDDPKSRRLVEKARREGATDDDIKELWNLPDLARRMVIWSENIFRYSIFLHAKNHDRLSDEDAAARVHNTFPIYGDPDDTCSLSGDNRRIQDELRGRVDSYKLLHGAEYIADQVEHFSSYNTFVRHAIKNGLI